MKYPFLISIPHGGVEIPAEVAGRFALLEQEIDWYCDPATRTLFDFGGSVEATIDTPVSRMVIDLNRPPLPLPPRDPDGVIKVRTVDGRQVYLPGQLPDLPLIHRLMMKWYFPYHQRIDELIDRYPVEIAFDCHSMLPYGSAEQNDAGKPRPLICLGNYGDENGGQSPEASQRARRTGLPVLEMRSGKSLAGPAMLQSTHRFPGDLSRTPITGVKAFRGSRSR